MSWIAGTSTGEILQIKKLDPVIFKVLSILEAILESKIQCLG